jgi:hypothetical protein
MIARLILALLVATFAFPAIAPAACHDASRPAPHVSMAAMNGVDATSHDHLMPDHRRSDRKTPDDRAAPPHGCIGCVPPSSWSSARIVGVVPRDAVTLVEHAAVFRLGTGGAPGLRPPREA